MGIGYFGKLPAKADFLTNDCPVGFLRMWEPFLIKGIAQSRIDLKDAWEEAYMTMPIWRFRLQPCDTGSPLKGIVTGALMPSVDRVGRKFPLTVMATASPKNKLSHQTEEWFEKLEAVLLSALEEKSDLHSFRQSVAELENSDGEMDPTSLGASKTLKADSENKGASNCEFWCRAGREDYSFACSGIPAASEFRWLILPETYKDEEMQGEAAGKPLGQNNPEDHQG
ncbi:type VI secretion-associated protein, family [Roseibium album]|nr:type VI secretion-associated protein, family [Roseibium album]